MKTHLFDWIILIIIVVALGTWAFTNYGIIHEKHLTEATVTEKTHGEKGYFITVDDQKLHVKDTNTWMVLTSGESYEISYEWYGNTHPYVVEINQAHDDDGVGGGH
ncbi:hypothetical protein MUO14_08665 [Halobacillus shinanisalinarum]|uniref:DUF3139 domain-containing protein n=1 Tax=Halobacillus shinanisalinarum TaxID=2932258 RepID=A0ABY4H5W7_9BACI|nr:hypothetical protein [Halobacillus shinanisalinarum]UOQ94982.1 hypothetical protein MUO14_08665 [Halobacillus shinanisalinarum]